MRASSWDGHVWTWTRDAHGRVLTETDPLGNTTQVTYLDADGQSVRIVDADGRVYVREVSADERTLTQYLPGNRTRTIELSFCGG